MESKAEAAAAAACNNYGNMCVCGGVSGTGFMRQFLEEHGFFRYTTHRKMAGNLLEQNVICGRL